MLDFCNALNRGELHARERIGWQYYVRAQSDEVPPGLPELPAEWMRHVLEEPAPSPP
jgi:hypothetical protein